MSDEGRQVTRRGRERARETWTGRRVELNAMTARPFVNFIERKLIENRVQKVVPQTDITEQHALRLVEQGLARDAPTGSTIGSPKRQRLTGCRDPNEQIRLLLKRQPELSWDIAGNDRQRRLLKDGRIKNETERAS